MFIKKGVLFIFNIYFNLKAFILKFNYVTIGIVLIYILITFLCYLFQDKFLFMPKKLQQTASDLNNDSTIEAITIQTGDSKYLHGWFCKKQIQGKQKTIIYFGGNGDEVSSLVQEANHNLEWAILLINYPGYGNSDGQPSETIFFDSALKIYDYATSRNDIDKNNIVIMGRSIGTGVATFLASKKNQKGVILISPFASMNNVVKEKFWFLPIDLILKSKFECRKYACNINSPLLCIYGTRDKIIPMKHSMELMKYWRGEVEYRELIGFNHDNLIGSMEVWNCINEFLTGLDKKI